MKHLQVPVLLLLCCATVLFSQTTWTSKILGDTLSFRAVSYGNNLYVTTGQSGIIYTSPDGNTWTKRTSGTTYNQYAVTYANNKFVSVGIYQTIQTSPDGITWTTINTSNSGALEAVTYDYSESQYVAVGYKVETTLSHMSPIITYYDLIMTSSDGKNWVSSTTTPVTFWFNGITYNNNKLVAVGRYRNICTATGSIISWITRYSEYGARDTLCSVTYGNNLYAAVGDSGVIITSPDGITWTKRTSGTIMNLTGVAYGNNQFVAVGTGGTIISSPDGITWTSNTSGVTTNLWGVTYGNNRFVAVGANETILTFPPANNAVTYTVPKQNLSVVGKTMQIYTLQGKLVSNQLVNNENYMDGKNSLYNTLSKGMYIVRIPTDNIVISRRVLVE
jgi:hypothetical protein